MYAQLHLPTPDGPEPIQPVAVFQTWHTAMYALGHEDRSEAAVSASLGSFQCAVRDCIAAGPGLVYGLHTFAHALEYIHLPELQPYFLGHTYLRSLQLALGRGSTEFLKDEVFFEFVLRILRTSKLFDLDETISWDALRRAHTVDGWVDIVRDAPVQRIAASLELEERADILHFIATGECRDSESVIDREMRWFQGAFPALWTHLQWFARSCNVDGADGATLVIGALISCKRLNLSSLGMARIVGVIDGAWAPDSAVCLRVDQATWWLQASNASIELLTGSPGVRCHGWTQAAYYAIAPPSQRPAWSRSIAGTSRHLATRQGSAGPSRERSLPGSHRTVSAPAGRQRRSVHDHRTCG